MTDTLDLIKYNNKEYISLIKESGLFFLVDEARRHFFNQKAVQSVLDCNDYIFTPEEKRRINLIIFDFIELTRKYEVFPYLALHFENMKDTFFSSFEAAIYKFKIKKIETSTKFKELMAGKEQKEQEKEEKFLRTLFERWVKDEKAMDDTINKFREYDINGELLSFIRNKEPEMLQIDFRKKVEKIFNNRYFEIGGKKIKERQLRGVIILFIINDICFKLKKNEAYNVSLLINRAYMFLYGKLVEHPFENSEGQDNAAKIKLDKECKMYKLYKSQHPNGCPFKLLSPDILEKYEEQYNEKLERSESQLKSWFTDFRAYDKYLNNSGNLEFNEWLVNKRKNLKKIT